MTMNVLVLAAGKREANADDGDYPVCLAELDGVPVVERLVSSCAPLEPCQFIFALRESDVRKYHLDNIVTLLAKNSIALKVQDGTCGAACTALLAIDRIDNDHELLVVSGNELLTADFGKIVASFRDRRLDAGTVVFSSVHPRYSYVRLDDDGQVIEAAEKNPISRNATASFYWFARGSDFVRAAQNMIRKDAHVGGLFYICPALNELVLEQKRVATYAIDVRDYHPLKNERQIMQYESLNVGKTA